ncbi:hypothetical protein NXV86_02870 [Bacteroides sp. BFG-257]|uniref:hypothetical protein n=1 Tax=Bacteroides sp. BFG-257 TaxID=2972761 RepID=UPI00216272E3|nr:hypothetical protein [Bacteroides sp. BFG-257]UVO99000.1 hypothetical protein NXV86_02870 [Bacteroides sp. BFG-257]
MIHQAEVSGKADIDIYELNFPPIPVSSFKQPDVVAGNASQNNQSSIWLYIIAGILVITGMGVFYYRKKKAEINRIKTATEDNKQTETNSFQPEAANDSLTNDISEIKIEMPMHTEATTFHNYDFSKECVCFFGGFRVIDKEGNDITSSFTPTLKSLLILLVLYTGRDPKGIIGHKLIQLLWYDKTDESAKNNRNVYMSKLRGLLEKVGDIKILNQNGFWSIQFEEGTICDYLEALHLYKENNSQNLEKLLELLLRGIMLPNMEIDWIDAFKNDFSNSTIDLFLQVTETGRPLGNIKAKNCRYTIPT